VKFMLKHTLLNLMYACGAAAPFRLAHRGKVIILTYHRFSECDGGLATSARAFRKQLDYLTGHYSIIPLAKILELLTNGLDLPPSPVAITIDDGHRDAYEIAFPILARYHAPATMFVVTDFIDRKSWLWTDKLPFLTTRTRASEFEMVIDGLRLRFELSNRASRLEAASRINAVLKSLRDERKDVNIVKVASSMRVDLTDLS